MIRLAEQLTLLYALILLPLQVAAGFVVGGWLGLPLAGAVVAGALGLGPAHRLPGFAFTVVCAVAWVVLLPRLPALGQPVSEQLLLWVGGAALLVPYILLWGDVRDQRASESERREVDDTLDSMPLDRLVTKLAWISAFGDDLDQERAATRIREGEGEAARLIIERYGSRQGRTERSSLFRALGAGGHPVGLAFLGEILRSGQDFTELCEAAEASGETEDRSLVGPLAKLLERSENHLVTTAAFEALGRIGSAEAVQTMRGHLEVEAEDVEGLTEAAVRGFAWGRAEAAVPWLAEIVDGEGAARPMYFAAFGALGAIGTPDALACLERVLDGVSDADTLRAVFMGIDEEDGRAIPWLAELLAAHESTEVRGRAAEALLEMRSHEGLAIVHGALRAEEAKPPDRRDQQLCEDLRFYSAEAALD